MSVPIDYYKVLGISESASQDEIKKAYRKLAKENHPDSRGGDKAAEEKFKQISEAYSVLGDSQKRSQYDMMRRGGFSGEGFGFPGGNSGSYSVQFGEGLADNLQDIFSNLFGGGFNGGGQTSQNPFGGRPNFNDFAGSRDHPRNTRRGTDMESTITVPFEMAVNGGETVINTGTGKKVKIKIPSGVEDGKKIRIRGQGGPSKSGGPNGDLYLIIKVAAHPDFERKGNDIHSRIYINIAEAVLGTEVYAGTVSGKRAKLKIPPGTSSGKLFRLPGLGVPGSSSGDHYVRIEIQSPEELSIAQKRDFKSWAKKAGLLKK